MNRTIAILSLCVAGCAHGNEGLPAQGDPEVASPPAASVTEHLALGAAELTLPEGVVATVRGVMDFQLIDFAYEGQNVLGAYAGNAPSFPSAECGSAVRRPFAVTTFRGWEARCASSAPLYREIVLTLGGDYPQFLHFMQPDQRRELGDAIIASVHAKDGPGRGSSL